MLPLRLDHPEKVTIAETQDEFHAMDVVFHEGEMISVWQPSEIERLTIANGGCVKLSIAGVQHPPVMLMAQSKDGEFLAPMSIMYIVWNADKTDCFATKSNALAYEVRKGAESNCFDEDGKPNALAEQFCMMYGDQDCTVQTVAC